MELGRECMALWGYEYIDELVWVKTNQLQRIIRTGRTGHWLNHGKEHCLVSYYNFQRLISKKYVITTPGKIENKNTSETLNGSFQRSVGIRLYRSLLFIKKKYFNIYLLDCAVFKVSK